MGPTVARLIAASLMIAGLAACDNGNYHQYRGDVGTTDVEGTWTADCGGTIRLDHGGAATLTNVPSYDEQKMYTDPADLYTGRARWSISQNLGWTSDTEPPTLDLVIQNFDDPLEFAAVDGKLGLALDIGPLDRDSYCEYTRSAPTTR
ncbi:hypothetical protein ABH926_010055 [Catenulispora sp. GP43]|uniref:hypothetical protein n=1 Tax=Catenulispora sp. GP43 TaxID=3156263 RepID=UPI003515EBF7